jgi:hypothetical protein
MFDSEMLTLKAMSSNPIYSPNISGSDQKGFFALSSMVFKSAIHQEIAGLGQYST